MTTEAIAYDTGELPSMSLGISLPRLTLFGPLQRATPWLWLYCEKCPHHAPLSCLSADDPIDSPVANESQTITIHLLQIITSLRFSLEGAGS
jgi:hypothetical protein